MGNDILIIGSGGYSNPDLKDCKIHSVEWLEKPFPNLQEFDLVIINLLTLDEETLKKIDHHIWGAIRDDCEELIKSNRAIYCILNQEIETTYKGYIVSNYSWCPYGITLKNKEGSSKNVTSFKEYHELVKKWKFVIENIKMKDSLNGKLNKITELPISSLSTVSTHLATNKSSTPLSAQVYYASWSGEGGDYSIDDIIGGSLYLLAPPSEGNIKEAIDAIFKEIFGKDYAIDKPDWVKEFNIPEQDAIQKEIESHEEKIKKSDEEIKTLQSKLEELERYKLLLYGTGIPLENMIKEVLRLFGLKIKDGEPNREEFFIEEGEEKALSEVKGNSNAISERDYAQLLKYLAEHRFITKNDSLKGILFGNHFRFQNPNSRDEAFGQRTIEYCKNQNICLITTHILFLILYDFFENKINKEEIWKLLYETKGVLEYTPR